MEGYFLWRVRWGLPHRYALTSTVKTFTVDARGRGLPLAIPFKPIRNRSHEKSPIQFGQNLIRGGSDGA